MVYYSSQCDFRAGTYEARFQYVNGGQYGTTIVANASQLLNNLA